MIPDYLKLADTVSAKIWGTLKKENRKWVIKGHPYMISVAKRVFPGSKGRERGYAEFAASKRIIGDLSWFMQRFPLKIEDKGLWLDELTEAQDHFEKQEKWLYQQHKVTPSRKFQGELMEFQKKGLAFLLHNPRSLLADQMGLGKTPVSLSWLSSLSENGSKPPYIAVVPPHILHQWKREINKFLGEQTRVHIIKGLKPYPLPDADIYLIHYLLLRGWKNELPEYGFNACIFDEIQELRRSESEKYSAASLLAESIDNVIGLSGTPIYNYGGEMWNILNILENHCLGDYGSFSREWCDGYYGSQIRNPDLFGEYLKQEGLLLRRTKEEVLDELPPKRRIVQHIDVAWGTYDKMISPVIDQAKKIPEIKDAWERGRESRQAIDQTRRVTGVAKAPYVCAFVKTLMEAGEKVLLYGYHHDVMDIYMEELREYLPVMISGRQNAKIKDMSQEAFMNGDTDLIIVSLRSGTGLNLQRARCVVFGEMDWSPAIHCIDEKTEILTKEGFQGVDDVFVGDSVAGFDIRDGSIQFVPALAKVDRFAGSDEVIYRTSTKKIDLAVTGNHRMVYRTLRRTNKGNLKSEWKIDTAENICGKKRRYIPTNGFEKSNGISLSDDELKLIGLFISDGNLHKNGRDLTIYQSADKPWNKEIVKILNGTGISWHLWVRKNEDRKDMNHYMIPKGSQQRKGWRGIGPYLNKDLSPLLDDVTSHQLDCLIYGIWLGDGSKTPWNVKRITNTNKIMLERLQSLCIVRGKTAILSKRKTKTSAGNTAYDLYISNAEDAYLQDGKDHDSRFKPDISDANGTRVWCINNKLGTIIVRRNGKVAVVGNSQCEDRAHRIGVKDSVLCYYLVCKAGTDFEMLDTLGLKTSQFVGIMGDRPEDDHDKMLAQTDMKDHMKKVIERLQHGGMRKEKPDPTTVERLRMLEKLPSKKEPTSLSDFDDLSAEEFTDSMLS